MPDVVPMRPPFDEAWSHKAAERAGWGSFQLPLTPYGAPVFRPHINTKVPATQGRDGVWHGRAKHIMSAEEIAAADTHHCGIGLHAIGGLTCLDLDCEDHPEHAALTAAVTRLFDQAIVDQLRFTRTGQPHRPSFPLFVHGFLATDPTPARSFIARKAGVPDYKIEVTGGGNQFVAHARHPSGVFYRWAPFSPLDPTQKWHGPSALPQLTPEELTDFLSRVREVFTLAGWTFEPVKGFVHGAAREVGNRSDRGQRAPEERVPILREIIQQLDNGPYFDERDRWAAFMRAGYRAADSTPDVLESVRQDLLAWCNKRYQTEGAPERMLDSFRGQPSSLGWDEFLSMASAADGTLINQILTAHIPPLTEEEMADIAKRFEDVLQPQTEFYELLKPWADSQAPFRPAPPKIDPGQGTIGRYGPPKWLAPISAKAETVTDTLARNELGLIIGDSAAGKSTFAISVALGIVFGTASVYGGMLDRAGSVIVVNNEDTMTAVHDRLRACVAAHDLDPGTIQHSLVIYPQSLVMFEKREDHIVVTQNGLDFIRFATAFGTGRDVALIVFDTLTSILSGVDENDAIEMQAVMRFLNDIARAGNCAVAVVHHRQKSDPARTAGLGRGSSAIYAAARSVLVLEAPGSAKASRRAKVEEPAPLERWTTGRVIKSSYSANKSEFHLRQTEQLVEVYDHTGAVTLQSVLVLVPGTPATVIVEEEADEASTPSASIVTTRERGDLSDMQQRFGFTIPPSEIEYGLETAFALVPAPNPNSYQAQLGKRFREALKTQKPLWVKPGGWNITQTLMTYLYQKRWIIHTEDKSSMRLCPASQHHPIPEEI